MLLYYSKRALTYQTDALRAMAGIICRLSERMECRFLVGLPIAAFDMFLVFRRNHSLLYRRKEFPSYSWAGWRGSLVCVSLRGGDYLRDDTWIIWYKQISSGVISLVWDLLAINEFPLGDFKYVGYRRRHAFTPPCPLPFPTNRTQPSEDLVIEARGHPILQFWTLSMHFNLSITSRIVGLARLPTNKGSPAARYTLTGWRRRPSSTHRDRSS